MAGLIAAVCLAMAAPCLPASAETDYVWSGELDCTECHAAQTASLVWEDPAQAEADEKDADKAETVEAQTSTTDVYAARHATQFGLACITCHVDDAKLEKGHKRLNSGKEATKLKKTKVTDDVCLSCHKAEQLAEATEDCQILTDSKGTVANPHSLPDSTSSHAEIACVQCHSAHDGARTAENATAVCASCHHSGVYECGTCH